jgi:hypothetical protein
MNRNVPCADCGQRSETSDPPVKHKVESSVPVPATSSSPHLSYQSCQPRSFPIHPSCFILHLSSFILSRSPSSFSSGCCNTSATCVFLQSYRGRIGRNCDRSIFRLALESGSSTPVVGCGRDFPGLLRENHEPLETGFPTSGRRHPGGFPALLQLRLGRLPGRQILRMLRRPFYTALRGMWSGDSAARGQLLHPVRQGARATGDKKQVAIGDSIQEISGGSLSDSRQDK